MALAILLGSAAAGPLYAAFPVAAVFVKKGASFRNVIIFIGAWSTTKIPMLLFEISALGARFAVTRLIIDIPGIFLGVNHLLWLTSSFSIKANSAYGPPKPRAPSFKKTKIRFLWETRFINTAP